MNGDARRSKRVTEMTWMYFLFKPSQIRKNPTPPNNIGRIIANAKSLCIDGREYIGANKFGSGDSDNDNSYIAYKNRDTNYAGNHTHALDMANAGEHTHTLTTDNKGGGQAHENRPPYYALAFIMFKGD